MLATEDIGALGHKVHATEDDVAAFGLRSLEGELEGITAEIGEFDDFVALVMMAQNHDIAVKTGFRSSDAIVEGIVRDEEVRIKVAANTGLDFRRAERWRLVCADEGAAIRNGY